MRRICLLALIAATILSARVVRVEITSQRGHNGPTPGLVGPYRLLTGKLHFAIDPNNPANRIITDIDHAPLNERGEVEFSADFALLRPGDASRGNGSLLLDILNRGNQVAIRMFNRSAETGDGFLMKRGFSVLWVGWQHDVPQGPGKMRIYVPFAAGSEEPITGLVRACFTSPERTSRQSLGDRGHSPYPVADRDDPRNQLAVYALDGSRTVLTTWDFHNDRTIKLDGGFEPNRIYELVYVAKNPPVVGLGPAAIRDAAAHFKHNPDPLLGLSADAIDRVLSFGSSQSGRFLRGFLYHGFNRDEQDRIALDGVLPHIAGGSRGGFNYRFAQPSRSASHPNQYFPANIFPFTDLEQTDPETGRKGGILARLAAKHQPKVIYTNTSNEYWRSGAALTHTVLGEARDADLPANVRSYYIAGTQHGSGSMPPKKTIGQQFGNTMTYSWPMRALLVALDNWVASGKQPPPSLYPRIDRNQLVARKDLNFPKVPGVNVPLEPRPIRVSDYGPEFAQGIIAFEPPKLGPKRVVLVPAVDDDGNEASGIRLPDLQAPLGSYTGWNLYDPEHGMPDQINLAGSYIPFPTTQADRQQSHDPRRSIEERYPSRADYLGRITEAALDLVDQGYVLPQDVPAIIASSSERWDYAHKR